MSKIRSPKQSRNHTQQMLFQAQDSPPIVGPEVLAEVHAALVELLLEAAHPSETEARDEREDL